MREGFSLFDLDNKSFLTFIDNLTEDEIKSNIDFVIYRRGREYYDKELVKNVSFDSAENTVSAIVKGGEKYSVRIFSEKFFVNRIKKELPFTGENHYMKIAEAIDQISTINRERAGMISDELRTKYKRRTSLIKMISRF